MQVKPIPEDTLVALMTILPKYIPGITPQILVSALKAFDNAATANDSAISRPMTKQEVKTLLGISMPTLDKLLQSGKLRKIQSGIRSVRIDRQSVADYLKA